VTIDMARRKQAIVRWHRRAAVLVSLWLAVLAVSGVAINHANDLGLDRSPLPAAVQRWVYGTEPAPGVECSADALPAPDCARVFARLPLDAGTLLLDKDNLYLLDAAGQLVEKLSASQFGLGELQAGAVYGDRVWLRDTQRTVQTDAELLDWRATDGAAANPPANAAWQDRNPERAVISWERLMLDLHAARFLGPLAPWFNDLVGLLMLLIVVSGIRLFRLKGRGNGT